MGKNKINFSYISLAFFILIAFSQSIIPSFYFAAVTIHELGHILAAKLFKIKIKELKLNALGIRINTTEKLCSYRDEFLLAAFGPLLNYISALLVMIFKINNYLPHSDEFVICSIILGTLNLLPIHSFDGGRMLKCFLLKFTSPNIANHIINIISFMIITLLWLISVYFLLIYSTSLGIFIFSSSLFFSIFLKNDLTTN